MKLGAIFQCYNEPYATYKTIESFRRLYPEGHIVAINDGAPEQLKPAFEAIAHYFEVDYKYEDRRSFSADVSSGTFARIHMQKREQIELYAKRFAWSIARLNEPYFVILEDDVLFLRHLTPEYLDFEINGCNPNVCFTEEAVKWLEQRRSGILNAAPLPKPNVYYGACGGCILKTEFFKKAVVNLDEVMDAFVKVVPEAQWAGDTFISFLCYSAGGMIGVNPEFCETWYNGWFNRVVLNKVSVLHKIKMYYGAKFTEELEKECLLTKFASSEQLSKEEARREVFALIRRS